MAPKDAQQLPGKEAALFRQIVKFYETKQYKKGIKAAEQVLKKYPEHGETLAMKGLICNYLERKEEAYDLVRKGLKAHLTSHVCWHVYGLLYRSDRNYDEAIKCYKNALRHDKENLQILRDLAQLQVQMRDLPGFVETRHTLLQLKPSNRNHWVAFAVAHHLKENYEVAVQVLDAYAGTLDVISSEEAYGYSEMLLYKAEILQQAGQPEKALEHLARSQDKIKDRMSLMELRGKLYIEAGQFQQAQDTYLKLLKAGPDNHKYHEGYRAAKQLLPAAGVQLTIEQRQQLQEVYRNLQQQFPRSNACKRIPLDFMEGDDFVAAASAYMKHFLARGIPALFVDLQPLYKDPVKQKALGALAHDILESLQTSGDFPLTSATEADGSQSGAKATPQTIVWTWAYLAQHEDAQGNTGEALNYVNNAIQHTPTLIELHSIKSKILKHAGDPQGATKAAEQARLMDLADRYLNCIAVRRLFRAGDVEGAEKLAALFTKDGEQVNNLHDMQCMWYELEAADEFFRRQAMGKALKMYRQVVTHFADFEEDQFDFHSYCIRKMTLRSYVAMLNMEDTLYSHRYYFRAAAGAIRCYLRLFDSPRRTAQEESEAELANLTAEDRRKLKQKRKKEAAKAAKAAEQQRTEAQHKAGNDGKGVKKGGGDAPAAKKIDSDPNGDLLADVAEPLAEATKLLTVLLQHSGERLAVQQLAYEVYSRKGRLMLALRAVKQACAHHGRDNADVHSLVVRFCKLFRGLRAESAAKAEAQAAAGNGTAPTGDSTAATSPVQYKVTLPSPTVLQVIDEEVTILLDGTADEKAYNKRYCARIAESPAQDPDSLLKQRLAAASMTALLDAKDKQAAMALLLDGGVPCGASHALCCDVESVLRDTASPLHSPEAATRWHSLCKDAFKWSSFFDGAERVEVLPLHSAAVEAEPHANGIADGLQSVQL